MGQLTRDAIVSAGLNVAGRTDIASLANTWLNAWLRSQYKAWPWPFLHRRATGVTLNAGTAALTVGAGSGGVALEIQQVRDPIWIYDSVYGTRVQARIRNLIGGPMAWDETINNPATARACPQRFKVRANALVWGAWDLVPNPIPDVSYLLALDYLEQPADISDGSKIPLYPNDRTMIQAVVASTLQYLDKRADYQAELAILGSMTIDDRVKYGGVEGTNDTWALDGSVFL